jgi:hypothetical protein
MARPKYDSGLCFDAASAPDERRLSGPAVDSPSADWTSPGVSDTPWYPSDEGPSVDEWKAPTYGGAKVAGTGDTITQDTPAPGTATLDDSAGAFTSDHVGREIEITGATAPGNNGKFAITAVNSASQLEYTNASAVTVTESFTYEINPSDEGYGTASEPTKSWRFDVELPDGWYTRVTRGRKVSGEQ